jgi:hypothetical protein
MSSFQDLTSLDLRQLTEELAAQTPSQESMGAGEWLGVVEYLTLLLIEGCGGLSREDWVRCSVALDYALGAARALGIVDHHEEAIRRLNLSAALLQRIPPSSEIAILNPIDALDIFRHEIPLSADDAREMAAHWRDLDVAKIRRLRLARSLVSPVLIIAKALPEYALDELVNAWTPVFPLLP